MTDPENPAENVHRFEYDGLGRLLRDTSPGGLVQGLERTESDQSFSVSLTTGMGRRRTHKVTGMGDGASRRIVTRPDGTSTTTDLLPGRRSTRLPTGSTLDATLNGDTRFGMQAPFAGEVKIAQGMLSPMTIATRRVADLKDASDLLSLTSLTETTNVNGRAFTNVWDSRARTHTTISPEGRRYVETLDKLGYVVETQLGALEPTEFQHDSFGRVIALTSASRVAKLGFDDAGNLVKSVDPLKQATKFGYDAVGRLTQTTLADSQPIAFGYDANFNLVSVTPPGKEQHGFAFGLGDLLTSYAPPALGKANVATRYEYNADQQLVAVTRPDEGTLELKLEKSTGQLTSINFPEGSVSLEYDPKTGQLSSATRDKTRVSYAYQGNLPTRTTWAGEIAGSVARSYDKNFWVISEQVRDRPAVSFSYDKDGLLIAAGSETLTRDAAQGFVTDTKLSSVTDSMSYSSVGEPSAYSASASGKELLAQSFERDALGRVTQVTETTAGATHTIAYTYSPRGWLKSVTRDGAEEQSFEYDDNGNRTTIKLAGKATNAEFDAQDRLNSQGDVRFDYSLNGELATKEDAAGTTSYSYDALGNLLSVEQPNGAKIGYVIDPAGRRVGKKLDGRLTKGFLYSNGLQPVAELDGVGNVTSVFVYASRPNVPDYVIRGTTTYRIISDLRGSPRLVVNAATGAIAQRLDYDSWGNVTADTSPGFQPFGFAGGLYDPDTGLVRFGARDYDASVGRWVSKDPLRFGGGQANLFLYVEDDPINLTDPSGLMLPVIAASAAIGAATGFVGNALVQVAQKGWGCVDWGDAAISGGVGAIQGALAPLGGGLGLTALVGAGAGGLQYVATESSHGRELRGDRAWAAVLLGGLGGGLGKALSPGGAGGLGYWEGRAIGGLDQAAASTLNGTGVATATSIRAVGASLASSTVSNLPGAD